MKKFEVYKVQFTDKARKAGYSEDNINICLKYSEKLINNDLPIIYNSNHLAALVGYHQTYITRAILSTQYFYRHFTVPKKNGKLREISEPLPSLKEIQHFILSEILYKLRVSKYCKSYVSKRNIKDFLKYHVDSKVIITFDIQDFFPSIKHTLVYDFFHSLGYSKSVSIYLSDLCTYVDIHGAKIRANRYLPQGAPTSPYLSNLILSNFDNQIGEYCTENKIKYTRYADDLAFSGNNIDVSNLERFVRGELFKYGLRLNRGKTNIQKQNVPQVVSGVVINKKLQLPKEERNNIRNIVFFIKKFGIENHMERISETRGNYLTHLIGKIQYGLYLNPKDVKLTEYLNFVKDLYKNQK